MTATPHLSNGPGPLSVHGGVGPSGERVLPRVTPSHDQPCLLQCTVASGQIPVHDGGREHMCSQLVLVSAGNCIIVRH